MSVSHVLGIPDPALQVHPTSAEQRRKISLNVLVMPHLMQPRMLMIIDHFCCEGALLAHSQFGHYQDPQFFSVELKADHISGLTALSLY